MAKIAELHNGTQIHFPDTMGDMDMDAAVKKHLGVPDFPPEGGPGAGPGPMDGFLPVLMQALGQHLQSQETGRNNDEVKQKQLLEEQANISANETAHKIKAMNGVGQVIAGSLQVFGQEIARFLETQARTSSDIVNALDNLSHTIIEVGKLVVATLNTPREISHDEAGVPKMIGPATFKAKKVKK